MDAHRDAEPDAVAAAGGDQVVAVEARVGAHRELARRASRAHPADRLEEEVGGAPDRVRAARAEAGGEDVTPSLRETLTSEALTAEERYRWGELPFQPKVRAVT